MINSEIKANELIIEAIEKLIEKYQKKADKERAKIKEAFITYKGDKYYTKNDILEAYGCGCFSEKVCDRLIEQLNNKMCGTLDKSYTENELIIIDLNEHKNNLLREIADDKRVKEEQARKDKRIQELIAQGCSYKEAVAVLGNEELMKYE